MMTATRHCGGGSGCCGFQEPPPTRVFARESARGFTGDRVGGDSVGGSVRGGGVRGGVRGGGVRVGGVRVGDCRRISFARRHGLVSMFVPTEATIGD